MKLRQRPTAATLFLTLLLTPGLRAQPKTAAQKPGAQPESKRVMLPNGWSLSPAGRSLEVGDLPLNLAVSASGKWMAVTNNGQGRQSIQLIDAKNEKVVDDVEIPKSFYGLKFSRDENHLYASGGNDNWILKYAVTNNRLVLNDSLKLGEKWPNKISPVGIEVDDVRNVLYAVTKENNSLYVVDLKSKEILHQEALGHEAYACVLSPDRKELYVSLWGGKKVGIFDVDLRKITHSISVAHNPNELVLTRNGQYLFVANAGDNSVSVIDTKTRKVVEVLDAALYPDSPVGSVTNGLALSEDEKTLYIANADNNALSVFDVRAPGRSQSKGFIPVGWYPTNVKVLGKRIFVTNGKGFTSFANPKGPNPNQPNVRSQSHLGEVKQAGDDLQYIGNLMKGTLSIIDEPDKAVLAEHSKRVYANTPYRKETGILRCVCSGKNTRPTSTSSPGSSCCWTTFTWMPK